MEQKTNVLPLFKNPKGKIVSTEQKLMIINLYNAKMNENPDMTYKERIKLLSKDSGIGIRTVCQAISDYKNKRTISSNTQITRIRKSAFDKIEDFQKSAIRYKVYEFWLKGEEPNLKKILQAVNDDPKLPNYKRTTLYRVLNDLNFEYARIENSTNLVLVERDNIIRWRRNYLESIKKYREEKRPIYFLGETQIDMGKHKTPLIVFHIGSVDGFVPGGLHYFVSSTKNRDDYNKEMSNKFFNWFKEILLLLKDNSVIIMDTQFYHSLDEVPAHNWKKEQILKWLKSKNKVFDKSLTKVKLLEIVKKISPVFNKYIVDDYAEQNNKTVVRLPPHYCEFNPFNMVWTMVKAYVKINNTTFKLPDVCQLLLEGIKRVSNKDWIDFINRTEEEEENRFWLIDFKDDT